jgi:ribosomal protein S12 methylthiotransferase accessory factor
MERISSAERIAHPISTGCAADTRYEGAVLRAISEVIERDAIALVWLQRLALPRIEIDEIAPSLAPMWDQASAMVPAVQSVFFDATTDIGVPTVYSLQIAAHEATTRTVVACATDRDPSVAVAKVIRDAYAARLALANARSLPDAIEDYTGVLHGAALMARPENSGAFEFLLQSPRRRRLSEMAAFPASHDPMTALGDLLRRLLALGFETYVVDLTTDEARMAGLTVVRAIVPGLQPLSFHHRARYLGHPRLYQAPRAIGHASYEEGDLNPWPQPFA